MLNKIFSINFILFFIVKTSLISGNNDHHFNNNETSNHYLRNETDGHLDENFDSIIPLENHHFDTDHHNLTEHLDHVIDHPNPDEEKSIPVTELYGADFREKLLMYSFGLVYFDKFDSSNEHLTQFNEAAIASKKLDFNHLTVIFARVDCINEVTLCKENSVTKYPTIKFYRRGDAKNVYDGPIKHDHITNYLFSQIAHKDLSHIFDDEL